MVKHLNFKWCLISFCLLISIDLSLSLLWFQYHKAHWSGMLDTVHQIIKPRPTHTKAGVLVIQWTLLNKNNIYLGPPRSTSNSSDFFFWNWLLHRILKYVVTNFRKEISTITSGPWRTQIKVVRIQKGPLDNQNPGFCMGWPGLYLLDSIEHSRSVCYWGIVKVWIVLYSRVGD